eukprot:2767719-Rhodomonas_salina.1
MLLPVLTCSMLLPLYAATSGSSILLPVLTREYVATSIGRSCYQYSHEYAATGPWHIPGFNLGGSALEIEGGKEA